MDRRGNNHLTNFGYSTGYERGTFNPSQEVHAPGYSHAPPFRQGDSKRDSSQSSFSGHARTFEQHQASAANQWAEKIRQGRLNLSQTVNPLQVENITARLQSIWLDDRILSKKEKSVKIYETLLEVLPHQVNPWEAAFYFFTQASDYSNAKPSSLSFQILVEFQKWVASNESLKWGPIDSMVTQDLRIRVLEATTGKHISYFNTAVRAFGLDHAGNDYFLPWAKNLLSAGKLTEAAQVISKLGLQPNFSQEEVMMPLLFTDKVNVLESYVTGSPEQQQILLQLLDHLCVRTTDILSFARSAGIQNIKGEKLSKKVLSKFAMRLIKLFDIPPETCPNITENRAMGAVRYLLYKYYIEKSMTHDSWADMVESTVGESTNLHQQLITELLGYNDRAEALLWADRFNLDDSVLDTTVVEARQEQRLEAESQPPSLTPAEPDRGFVVTGDDWDTDIAVEEAASSYHYKMPIPSNTITIVTDKAGLDQCLQRITMPETRVGIDAEWKPSMGKTEQLVALLQLAVKDCVFLIDCVKLRDILTPADWAALGKALFCNSNTVKLGFGLGTDVRMLTTSFPSMQDAVHKMCRVVDLEKLARSVLSDYDSGSSVDAPHHQTVTGWSHSSGLHKKEEKGLSLLCLKTLGKPLSKTEQMSNWEKRPLRQAQIAYAASDAYVLLEIHSKLLSLAQQMGLTDLEPPVHVSAKTRMDKKKAKAARETRRRQNVVNRSGGFPVAAQSGPISPRDLRVVCDTMLQGLGSQLRTCGVDTYIMGSSLRHTDAIQISLRENRYVLTTKGPYDHIRANVGESMSYCVDCSKTARDQCLDVLRYFQVHVKKEDIFSRCCICNSTEFAFLPSADMESLYMFNLQQQQQSMMGHPPSLYDMDQGQRSRFLRHNIDPATITFLHNRVRVQVETVPKAEVFAKIDEFFVCMTCGKVYWEGSHHERVVVQFENILNLNLDESQSDETSAKEEEEIGRLAAAD